MRQATRPVHPTTTKYSKTSNAPRGKRQKTSNYRSNKKGLKALALRAGLKDTVAVELAIARYAKQNGRPATNSYKSKLCDCHLHYCRLYKIEWKKPTCTPEPASIQPLTDAKCDLFVASARGDLSLKIALSTQTGVRPCEIGRIRIEAKDIHPDACIVVSVGVGYSRLCLCRLASPICQVMTCLIPLRQSAPWFAGLLLLRATGLDSEPLRKYAERDRALFLVR